MGHLDKKKQTDQPGNIRESYSHQNTQIHAPKKKSFLYSNEGTIDYNQQCHLLHLINKQYKQFPQQKKISRKRKRGRESAKGKENEMGKRRKKRRKERKRECEGEGERETRGRMGENRESDTKKSSSLSTPLSPDAFPSTIPPSDEARE